MASLKVELSKHKKLIIIVSIFLFVFFAYFLNMYILGTTNSYFWGSSFNISSQDTHPEVIDWMAESDISGKGVFVLRLSRERTDQFFIASARSEDQELPVDVFGAFIYINNFENDDIERVFGRTEIVDSTFKVFYQTNGTHEYLKDTYLNDNNDIPEQHIDYFPGYELSEIHAVSAGITNLEIFINGEKVSFHISMLD